jgi:hypothetical protein
VLADSTPFVLRSAEQALIVRGNVMQLVSASVPLVPLVSIHTLGTCTFGANDCRTVPSRDGQQPLVDLDAETAVVDTNHLLGNQFQAININASFWNVIGNMHQGSINVRRGSGTPTDRDGFNTRF